MQSILDELFDFTKQFDRLFSEQPDEQQQTQQEQQQVYYYQQPQTYVSQHYETHYDSKTGIRKEVEMRQIGDQWVRKTVEISDNGTKTENEEYHNIGKEAIADFEKLWNERETLKNQQRALPPVQQNNMTTDDNSTVVQTQMPPDDVNATGVPQSAPRPSKQKVVKSDDEQ